MGAELESSLADAFQRGHFPFHLPQESCRTLHNEKLQCLLMLQMNQLNGDDFLQILMLERGEPGLQIAFLVVVNQCQHAHHDAFILKRGVGGQMIANQRRQALGSIGKSPLRRQGIQSRGGILRHGNSESDEGWAGFG